MPLPYYVACETIARGGAYGTDRSVGVSWLGQWAALVKADVGSRLVVEPGWRPTLGVWEEEFGVVDMLEVAGLV